MKLHQCGLWIDLSLILNFNFPAADAYRSVGVGRDLIHTYSHDYPYYSWLLDQHGQPDERRRETRDMRLQNRLAIKGLEKTSHRAGFHFAKLFEEAGGNLAITSHETPETTAQLVSLLGFKNAQLFPLRHRANAHQDFAAWDRAGHAFSYVLERGVHLNAEQKILQQLADKGIIVNVKSTNDLNSTIAALNHKVTL